MTAQEAMSIAQKVENACTNELVGRFGDRCKNFENQFCSLCRNSSDAFIYGHLAEFVVRFRTEVSQIG